MNHILKTIHKKHHNSLEEHLWLLWKENCLVYPEYRKNNQNIKAILNIQELK